MKVFNVSLKLFSYYILRWSLKFPLQIFHTSEKNGKDDLKFPIIIIFYRFTPEDCWNSNMKLLSIQRRKFQVMYIQTSWLYIHEVISSLHRSFGISNSSPNILWGEKRTWVILGSLIVGFNVFMFGHKLEIWFCKEI